MTYRAKVEGVKSYLTSLSYRLVQLPVTLHCYNPFEDGLLEVASEALAGLLRVAQSEVEKLENCDMDLKVILLGIHALCSL